LADDQAAGATDIAADDGTSQADALVRQYREP
jgi:hypothetical protein